MIEYITRDYLNTLPEVVKKEKEVRKKIKEIEGSLERVLIIGPREEVKCHVSENLYDCFLEEGYDVKFLSPKDLNLTELQLQKKNEYYLTQLRETLGSWKPQLIFIDECGIFFQNTQSVPVFYHHREFKRPPTVIYPTVAYFWHEDIIEYFEKMFAPLWMAQVPYKEVMYIAYDPKTWKPQKKTKKGLYGNGFREGFKLAYEINELANIADWMILEKEHEESKEYLNYSEKQMGDIEFRKRLPILEAFWCPISVRQYTTRVMLESMACKTLCFIKTQEELGNYRCEEIFAKMGLINDKHYIGVDKISDLPIKFKGIKNKEKIIENAYNLVSEKHTYKNRMNQIIIKYNEIMLKKLNKVKRK